MRKNLAYLTLLFSLVLSSTLIAQNTAYEAASSKGASNIQLIQGVDIEQNYSPVNLLYDNGPLVNSSGTGSGGADESVLQNNSLGLSILGFGHQISATNWVADDFTISVSAGWDLTSLVFHAYQTNSPTTPTIDDLRVMIYDDAPNQPGANLVWGDATTNVLSQADWTGVYRVDENSTGTATNRPIMELTCDLNLHLDMGTYWVVWQSGGTLGSGPWAPPININGQTTTGNALQSLDDGATFQNLLDSGTNTPQGLPFLVYGSSPAPVPVSNWAILIAGLLMTVVIVSRFLLRR
jgi:hypothetical protein